MSDAKTKRGSAKPRHAAKRRAKDRAGKNPPRLVRAPGSKSATPAGARVAAVRIAASGARWTMELSDGRRETVATPIATACRIRVGTVWSDALARRIETLAARQKLMTRAMGLLAKGEIRSRSELREALGSGREAAAAVAELARNGWIS